MIFISEPDFLAYLRGRHYSPRYNQITLNIVRNELQEVTNEEILSADDFTPMVEKILSRRYNSKDCMCATRMAVLRKLQDFLRMEAAA